MASQLPLQLAGQPMVETPPFVRWAVRHRCPFRLDAKADMPEQAERLLRAARELAAAAKENRLSQKVVLEPKWNDVEAPGNILGFAIEEAAAVYGGWQRLSETCGNCIANTQNEDAGCTGVITRTSDWPDDEPWHPLWVRRSLSSEAFNVFADQLANLVPKLAESPPQDASGLFLFADERRPLKEQLGRFIDSCRRARDRQLQINLQAFPGAQIEGRHWYIPAHCPVCGWSSDANLQCRYCLVRLRPKSKRLLRGTRPYRPLRDFLTEAEITKVFASASE